MDRRLKKRPLDFGSDVRELSLAVSSFLEARRGRVNVDGGVGVVERVDEFADWSPGHEGSGLEDGSLSWWSLEKYRSEANSVICGGSIADGVRLCRDTDSREQSHRLERSRFTLITSGRSGTDKDVDREEQLRLITWLDIG